MSFCMSVISQGNAQAEEWVQNNLRGLLKLLRVTTLEGLIKRLLTIAFAVILLVPLVLFPIYWLIYSVLH